MAVISVTINWASRFTIINFFLKKSYVWHVITVLTLDLYGMSELHITALGNIKKQCFLETELFRI